LRIVVDSSLMNKSNKLWLALIKVSNAGNNADEEP